MQIPTLKTAKVEIILGNINALIKFYILLLASLVLQIGLGRLMGIVP